MDKRRKYVHYHPVQIGISNGIKTEITSGISEGTQVINEANLGTDNESQPMVENNGENKEQSPFMPGRPGGKRNNVLICRLITQFHSHM